MAELLFLNILLLGTGILLLLFIRALPRVDEAAMPLRRSVFERWLTSRLPEKMDLIFRAVSLRTLRRLKVLTLRVDNGINQKLQRMKLESGEGLGTGKIDLKQIAKSRTASEAERVKS